MKKKSILNYLLILIGNDHFSAATNTTWTGRTARTTTSTTRRCYEFRKLATTPGSNSNSTISTFIPATRTAIISVIDHTSVLTSHPRLSTNDTKCFNFQSPYGNYFSSDLVKWVNIDWNCNFFLIECVFFLLLYYISLFYCINNMFWVNQLLILFFLLLHLKFNWNIIFFVLFFSFYHYIGTSIFTNAWPVSIYSDSLTCNVFSTSNNTTSSGYNGFTIYSTIEHNFGICSFT